MENFIGRNIKAFRTHKGFSQEGLGKIAKVSQSAESAWENGKSLPHKKNIDRLLKEFPELVHDDIFSAELGFASKVLDREAGVDTVSVALYGSIAAGSPIEMLPVEDEVPIPGIVHGKHPKSFLLRVSGESMNRLLPNGCLALVDPKAPFVDGKVYAVRVGKTDATVKRVRKREGGIELVPDSFDPTYEPQAFSAAAADEVEILGRIVWYCAPLGFGR